MLQCITFQTLSVGFVATVLWICVLSDDLSHLVRTLDSQHDPPLPFALKIEDNAVDRYHNIDVEWKIETQDRK
jgi:hypothetical protein